MKCLHNSKNYTTFAVPFIPSKKHRCMPYAQDIYIADHPLFRRNPVCALCWRECMAMCEEWDGQINFDLLGSMEVADKLCRRLIANAWTLSGVEYYYHWLEGQLGFSRPAVTCATAVVCLTLRLMEGLNEGLHQLGDDMRGLLWGEAGELYDNMRSEARRQDICLDATNYGEIPPDPNQELKNINYELTTQVHQLSQELHDMKQQISQYNIDTQYNNYGTIYNAPVTINNNYAPEPAETDKTQPVHTEEKRVEETQQQRFALLTALCVQEGKAHIVEAELRSAASGSAQKLMQCIRTNEALGYLDTKNMSTQALYDALNAYFGLKYKYQNFAKYRRE